MLYQAGERSVKISAVIITLNEERNIERCLRSVMQVADEIVVLDSGSSDRTREICEAWPVCYHERPFVRYDMQKNAAARKASYDHILSLDADEALSEELQKAIAHVKDHWQHDGYACNRLTAFCGKWIRHGEWYPDRIVRLFDRRKASWNGRLHERLQFSGNGTMGFLKGDLLHYSYDSVSHFLQKTDRYTEMAAAELYEKGVHPTPYHLYIKPAYRFLYAFIMRRGFLDGFAGYCIARLTAQRLFLKFIKLRILQEPDRLHHQTAVKKLYRHNTAAYAEPQKELLPEKKVLHA